MSDLLATLFNDFDRGRLTRRQLLQALGIAAAARPVSALAFGQGSCGGARAGTPQCDTTPAQLPFEPTGWKTVLLDHFSMQVADYEKEAAYFAALMNWKVRSDDGTKAALDIGDWGGLALRGGYQALPPPPTPPPALRASGRRRGRSSSWWHRRRLRLARVAVVGEAVAGRVFRASRSSTDSAGVSTRGTRRKLKPH